MNDICWLLAAVEQGRWRPGIGDPTPIGWFIAIFYLVVAVGCGLIGLAARRSRRTGEDSDSRFWLILFGLLVFLGINKQLDLQTLLGETGRSIAKMQGWYNQRRYFQLSFIIGLGIVGLIAFGALSWTARNRWRRNLLPLAGVIFLFVFILARASSFHHVDELLHTQTLGMRLNVILELAGITTVALGVVLAWKDRKRPHGERAKSAERFREPTGALKYTFERGILVLREEGTEGKSGRS